MDESRSDVLATGRVTADVWRADAGGMVIGDLPVWRGCTGQAEGEVLGRGWLEGVHPDHREVVAEAWDTAVARGDPCEVAFPLVSPDGAVRAVLLLAHPVDDEGVPRGWVGSVLDVTDSLESADLRLEAHTAETLRRIGSALVADLDLGRVVQQVTDTATELVGAEFGSFFYNVTDSIGESYMLYTLSGAPREAFEGFPMPRNTAVFEPTFRGEGIVRLDDVTTDPRYGRTPPFHGMPPGHLPVRSYLAVPVVSRRGEVLGGLFFGHARPGMFTAQHERLAGGVAVQAAIAIDNARLYQAAQREREAAQRVAERLGHLQRVSSRLAGAKDVDEVAEVVVTGAQDALECARAALYVVDDADDGVQLVRSSGVDHDALARWARLGRNAPLPVSDALRERKLVTVAHDEEWRARYPAVGDGRQTVALAVAPLVLGDQVFGAACFGWDAPRSFAEEDRQFLEALAGQCAQALERARLYEVERETARTLQRSLLPPRTPEIPGMEVAAVYRPGDRAIAVGGDFYDVFRIGPNRWGLGMGDVCGRGARAAARTALARYTLRAVATRGDSPVDALRSLNAALLAEPEADDRFCAAVFGHVELDRCGAWVTLACAGHPRPIVLRRAGWIDVRGQAGTLVGILDDVDITEDRVGLGPGDALVFFTDGISEARDASGEQFAEEALPHTLLAAAELDAEALAEEVRRAAIEFSGGTLADDVAVLVVRVPVSAADDPDERLRQALGAGADEFVPGYPIPHGADGPRPLPSREARARLAAHPSSPRAARRFLSGVLRSWRMPERAGGDAELLLSELATNAVLHARSGFTVIVRYDGGCLRVEVGDGSRAEPRRSVDSPPDALGGRGLVLLDTIASRWGMLPTARGKRVWFEVPAA